MHMHYYNNNKELTALNDSKDGRTLITNICDNIFKADDRGNFKQ
jgi:hypothetical protein